MKRYSLAVLVVFCLVGVVWAAAPNPQLPNLVGGSWTGTVRTSTGAIVPVKVAVTSQTRNALKGSLTLGAVTLTGATGTIDGTNFYMAARQSASPYRLIEIGGELGWYPSPKIIADSIYDETATRYGESILTPTP